MLQVQNNAIRDNGFLLQLLSVQDMWYAWWRDAAECLNDFGNDVSVIFGSISNTDC